MGVGLGLLLALGLVGASALLADRNARLLRTLSRSETARAQLAEVMNDLSNAETGQRGYLLTQKESYLAPYLSGRSALPAALDGLEDALQGAPGPLALMPELRRIVAAKLDELAEAIELAKAGDWASALALVQTDRGQQDMLLARRIVADIGQQQRSLLADQVETVNRGGRLLIYADAVGFVLLAIIVAAIAYGSWQAFLALRAAQAELRGVNDALSRVNETLEDRVAERTSELTEANDEIQRFAYIVSHDLRAPLVNIMGFTSEMEAAARTVRAFAARAAEQDPGGTADLVIAAEEDIPESLQFIKTSAAKMDRLIGAILKLSREGRRVLASEPVDMDALLAGIVASLRHQCDERGATVAVAGLPGVASDRLVLEQVFSNLVENAIKYLQPGRPGVIRVSGHVEAPMLVYEVADNGRGIAAHDMERVFELFRRAGDQSVPGEGIGLAHVRALVRRLGGRIDCVSAPGVGSTFRVALPQAGTAGPLQTREQEGVEP